MPETPKGPRNTKAPKPLNVKEEEEEILKVVAGLVQTELLPSPSSKRVLETLPKCRIAHFECHGISDSLNPSGSSLILQCHDKTGTTLEQDRLTVEQISDLQLDGAQIAYLSACSTAENKSEDLQEEVIHIVSGFQVAGFPHVIGCLWPAGDSECVEVAKNFYSILLKEKRSLDVEEDVAWALQRAVDKVRREDLGMPLNWAQFVHFGA
ncbi:hypothetical protein PT974_01569 [Cladobotryum mycophilum]|uniref:CHAT domain-containing protein n=1 Tax=Cladobotryum mycophilum TaxID=491253 RepID=A0ABR0T441_9HYPO